MPNFNRRSLLHSLGMAAMFASLVKFAQGAPGTSRPNDADDKSSASQQPDGPQSRGSEEDAIRKVVSQTSEAWNKKDAKACAEHYSDDADVETSRGVRITSRKKIEEYFEDQLTSAAHLDSEHKRTIVAVRFLTATCAATDSKWEVAGVRDALGKGAPPRKGNSTMILVKSDSGWKIALTRSMVPTVD
ncbi:MAG: SgcJ/EcaC family oxidoreductase [Planctomycetaceae bacterium]